MSLNEFCRTELLVGEDGIEKLHNSKVIVFGIGGVGSFVVEALTRAGVGNLILVDNDIVKEINYFNKSLGNKTIEIKDNSSLTINYFIDAIDDNNEINIYIGTNSSLVLNHSYMNDTNYDLKININYAGEKSNVLVNVIGVNNSGTSKVDIDGTLLKNNNNNINRRESEVIKINIPYKRSNRVNSASQIVCKPTTEYLFNKIKSISIVNNGSRLNLFKGY